VSTVANPVASGAEWHQECIARERMRRRPEGEDQKIRRRTCVFWSRGAGARGANDADGDGADGADRGVERGHTVGRRGQRLAARSNGQ
jgi:hypothetical protein